MTKDIHHITYDFSTAGLAEAVVQQHISAATSALAAAFDLPLDRVQVRSSLNTELDVHVMVGRGNQQCFERKVQAMRVVMPLYRYLRYVPAVVHEAAPAGGGEVALLRLLRPRAAQAPQLSGVANG